MYYLSLAPPTDRLIVSFPAGVEKKTIPIFFIFIEEQEELFFEGEESLFFQRPKKVRNFSIGNRGDEEIFNQIAWEFVFLRFGYISPETSVIKQSARMKNFLHYWNITIAAGRSSRFRQRGYGPESAQECDR